MIHERDRSKHSGEAFSQTEIPIGNGSLKMSTQSKTTKYRSKQTAVSKSHPKTERELAITAILNSATKINI